VVVPLCAKLMACGALQRRKAPSSWIPAQTMKVSLCARRGTVVRAAVLVVRALCTVSATLRADPRTWRGRSFAGASAGGGAGAGAGP
jgi:hypothetical protein